ncbi:MAG: ABC transporter permease [Thermoproteota archaeon]
MKKWLAIRITRSIVEIFAVITFTFFIIRLIPGNPAEALYIQLVYVQRYTPEAARQIVEAVFNVDFNEPLWNQYLKYITRILQGDMGKSYTINYGQPVLNLIMWHLPWTLFSVSIALVLSFFTGILLGMFIAYRRGGQLDRIVTTYSLLTASIPSYVIGILMIFAFCFFIPLFPWGGVYSANVTPGFNLPFIVDVLRYAALPIMSYFIVNMGSWALIMKNSTISVLGEDYVYAAEARGLKDRRIAIKYVGRNAIMPVFTSLLINLGAIFGGSVFIENLFMYRGVGHLMATALGYLDYPFLQGILNIITFAVIAANLIADVLYGKLDPRIRTGG